jgi:hypothetical protein
VSIFLASALEYAGDILALLNSGRRQTGYRFGATIGDCCEVADHEAIGIPGQREARVHHEANTASALRLCAFGQDVTKHRPRGP